MLALAASAGASAPKPVAATGAPRHAAAGLQQVATASAAAQPALAAGAGGSAFVQPLTVPLGLGVDDGVDGFAVADVNGDGKPDLVAVEHVTDNGTTNTTELAIALGNGDLSFQTPKTIPLTDGTTTPIALTGAALVPIVVADFEGTKKADIVVGIPGRNELLEYPDQGGGTYSLTPRVITIPGPAARLATADLGNGHIDLVVLTASATPAVLTLMGAGTGAFPTTATATFKSGLTPNDLAVIALTSSGLLDIVVSGYDAGNEGDDTNVGVLLNQGGGVFPSAVTLVNTGLDITGFQVGNFSGSGHIDLLVAGSFCDGATGPTWCQTLLPGKGDGTFGAATTTNTFPLQDEAAHGATPNVPIDLDGDGHPDALWVHSVNSSPTLLTVSYGNGAGGFTSQEWVGAGAANTTVVGITAADLTGSGTKELVVQGDAPEGGFTDVTGGLYIVVPDTTAPRRYETGSVVGPGLNFPSTLGNVVAGDFRGTGHDDIVATSDSGPGGTDNLELFPGVGDGTVGPPTTIGAPLEQPNRGPVSAGVDGAGHPILVWARSAPGGIEFVTGDGAGGFSAPTFVAGDGVASQIVTGDVNGDGHPDVIAEWNDDTGQHLQAFLWDPTLQTFVAHASTAPFPGLAQGADGPAVGVFTSSGHLDVAVANVEPGQAGGAPTPVVEVFPGDGTGGFAVASPIIAAPDCATIGTGPVTAGDLNGDGHDDLIYQCAGKVYVALGNGNGTFAAPTSYADPWVFSAKNANQLILAHVFSPTRLDVVEVGTGNGDPVVFPSNGDGTLGVPQAYAAGNDPVSAVTAAPLAGNGLDDLIVGQWGNSGHDDGLLTVLISSASSGGGLTVSNVAAPTSPVNPGQPITTSWTVTNQGATAVTGSWTDAVYGSSKPTFDASAELVGTVSHTGALSPGQSYTASLTAPLPGLAGGTEYLIVVPDSGGLFSTPPAGSAASPGFTVTAVPVLTIGGPAVSGTIAAGQVLYFQVSPAVGTELLLNATVNGDTLATFAERLGSLPNPTTGAADQTYPTPTDRNQTIAVPHPQGGTYYVMLVGTPDAVPDRSFTLLATQPSLAVTGFSPASLVGDAGGCIIPADPVCSGSTLTITGTGFTPTSTVTLLGTGISPNVTPTSVTFVNSNTLVATFGPLKTVNLGLPNDLSGSYNVEVSNGPTNVTATNPLVIRTCLVSTPVTGCIDALEGIGLIRYGLETPSAYRPPAPGTVTVSWVNTSSNDQPAPILELVGTNVNFNDPTTGLPDNQSEIQLLGVGSGEQPGSLAPGEAGHITITFSQPAVGISDFTLYTVDPTATLDWSQLQSVLQPPNVPAQAWAVDFANFTADAGSTLGSYEVLLDNAANYLGQIGQPPNADVTAELSLEFAAADDFGAISERFASGALGLGQADPTNLALTIDPTGSVTIPENGAEEVFAAEPGGGYASLTGDPAHLVKLSDGSYRLQSPDGTVDLWSSSGQFQSTTDSNGNSITAAYDGQGRLSGLNNSNGTATNYTYDAGNRLATVTPPSGRSTTFTYDSAGRVATETLAGTSVTFGYASAAAPPPDQNAVTTVADASGSSGSMTYDARGRLSSFTLGPETMAFAYGPFGEVTATDANGAKSTVWLDAHGRTALAVDPLGRVTTISFDGNLGPSVVTAPGGLQTTLTYDLLGDALTVTDPLGRVNRRSYDGSGRLTSATDPSGNTTAYARDAAGNVTAVTYPDGSRETATYVSNGELASFTDRAGHRVAYTYDANQRPVGESYDDGTSVSDGYDTAGDLATVSDPSGTVSYSYNAIGSLAKMTLPGGQSLSYTYDAAGRLLTTTDQSGFVAHNAYDSIGRLSGVTDTNGTSLLTNSYDAVGRLVSQQRANGTAVTYAYDADDELTNVTNEAPGGSASSSYGLAYASTGYPTSITGPGGATSLTFDAAGQLTGVGLPGGRTITYNYDGDANRTSVTDAGTTTNYAVNSLDEYTAVGTTTYTYDSDGRETSASGAAGSSSWTYDERGRLTGATTPGGSATYTYDALGERLSSTVGSTVTGYLPNPMTAGVPFSSTTAGTTEESITSGTTLVGFEPSGGSASFLNSDTNQNVVAETGPAGAITGTASYLPFGEVLATTGTLGAGFAGAVGVTSNITGQDLVQFRGYDPTTGRFLTPDLLGSPGSNRYTYAANDPVLLLDRNGLQPVSNPSGSGSTDVLSGATLVTSAGAQSVFTTMGQAEQALNMANNNMTILNVSVAQMGDETLRGPLGNIRFNVLGPYMDQAQLEQQGFGNVVDLNRAVGGALVVAGTVMDAAPLLNPNTPDKGRSIALTLSNFVPGARVAAHTTDFATRVILPPYYGYWYNMPDGNSPYGPSWGAHIRQLYQPGAHGFLPLGTAGTRNVNDHDPNDIYGPTGFGPQGWLPDGGILPFTIDVANQSTATAPVQVMHITDTLDPSLDPSTFTFGQFGFANTVVTPPAGLDTWSKTVPDTATVSVLVAGSFDPSTRLVSWTFTAVDPASGNPITDPTAGFLPPDVTPPEGEGFVNYSVAPLSGLATPTTISTQATVVFDSNPAMDTATLVNTIDGQAPVVTMAALPATSPAGNLTVAWTGSDGAGSGIASYTPYESFNGGPLTALASTTATSVVVPITAGDTYGFAVSAVDNVGNSDGVPAQASVTTAAAAAVGPAFTSPASTMVTAGQALSFTVKTTGVPIPALNATGTLPAGVTFTDNGDGTATLAGTAQAAGTYPLTFTAFNTQASTPQSFTLTVNPAGPASVAVSAGSGQSAIAGSAFTTPLAALVADQFGNPVPGVTVTFTAPASGASATFAGNAASTTAVTGANGIATASTLTANATTGPFTVTASVNGVANGATFSLTNTSATTAPTKVTVTGPSSIPAGSAYQATASANGTPSPTFSLAASPAPPRWLTIKSTTGAISGTVPVAGVTSFTYAVVARNRVGAATSATVKVTVTPAPVDVAVAMTHADPFVSGATGAYLVLVDERNSTTTPITLTDTLPAGVTYKSAAGPSWKCSASGQTVTCTYTGPFFFTLGFPLVLTVNVTAKPGTVITNTASITPNDPTPRDNTATDRVTVIAPPACKMRGHC